VKRFALALILGTSLFVVGAGAEELSGTISDSMCGKAHADASEKSQACVKACIEKKGAAPVFVSGDKVFKIDPESKEKVMAHLGHKVTINGSVEDDTITVDSIRM
jgi:hypothetical protein